MRPPTAVGTDADLNLLDAIRLAASPAAAGRGVLTILNQEIQSARDVTKTNAFRVDTFDSRDFGVLGYVDSDARVLFYRSVTRPHTTATPFDVRGRKDLPRVDIVHAYAGADGVLVDALTERRPAGMVLVGFGGGSFPSAFLDAGKRAVKAGIPVVLATRSWNGRARIGSSPCPTPRCGRASPCPVASRPTDDAGSSGNAAVTLSGMAQPAVSTIVMKFGGSSVADPDKVRLVARRFVDAKRRGLDVVGTVSAMGKTTDTLLALANDVSPSPNPRELDMLLSTGERIACAQGQYGGAPPASQQRPHSTSAFLSVAAPANSSARRLLPMPGSPPITRSLPCPASASPRARNSVSSSCSRPTKTPPGRPPEACRPTSAGSGAVGGDRPRSSAGSCRRIARSRSRSLRLGSSPSSSISSRRAS